MIIPQEATDKFNFEFKLLQAAHERFKPIIGSFCEKNGFAIVSRPKTIESVLEKIEAGRIKSWEDIDDLVAFSIITPSLQEEEEVIQFLKNIFKIVDIKKRGQTNKSPEVFRFDLTRVICNLADESEISKIKVEVQIRTAFEHAWSTSTHKIIYKADDICWKKQRLASQIKAAVEQLDQLIYSFQTSSESLTESPYLEITIKKEMLNIFSSWFEVGLLSKEFRPQSFKRIVDNLYELLIKFKFGRNMHKLGQNYKAVLEKVQQRMLVDAATKSIPASCSFFQLVLFYLIESGELSISDLNADLQHGDKFFVHVTKAMCDLKKEFSEIRTKFDYQNV